MIFHILCNCGADNSLPFIPDYRVSIGSRKGERDVAPWVVTNPDTTTFSKFANSMFSGRPHNVLPSSDHKVLKIRYWVDEEPKSAIEQTFGELRTHLLSLQLHNGRHLLLWFDATTSPPTTPPPQGFPHLVCLASCCIESHIHPCIACPSLGSPVSVDSLAKGFELLSVSGITCRHIVSHPFASNSGVTVVGVLLSSLRRWRRLRPPEWHRQHCSLERFFKSQGSSCFDG